MRILAKSIYVLGCLALVTGARLDEKLLQSLQNMHQVPVKPQDTQTRFGSLPQHIKLHANNQHYSDDIPDIGDAPLLQPNLDDPRNQMLKPEIGPPDLTNLENILKQEALLGLQKLQLDTQPHTVDEEKAIGDIILPGNAKIFSAPPTLVQTDTEEANIEPRLQDALPDNMPIPNILNPVDVRPNAIPPLVPGNNEILDDAKPKETPLDNIQIGEKETDLPQHEIIHPDMGEVKNPNPISNQQHIPAINTLPHEVTFNTIQNPNTIKDTIPEDQVKGSDGKANSNEQTNEHELDNAITTPKEEPQKCSLRQTMAWAVCDRKMTCSSACKTGDDCTFPYCNSLGLCECRQAECSSDRMCYFWRIECHGQFKCRNSKCICE